MKPVILLLLAGALMSAPVAALDVRMTDEERAACDAEGGCALVTREWVRQRVEAAFAAGATAGAAACKGPTAAAPIIKWTGA